ncbi:hypothetical protein BR93DRAFT_927747 [Coniochaeta sp. PMI_546]|nr:hypothetical protein BR93DRAFT_927747 [Coniochaeta sp. PMI_546]
MVCPSEDFLRVNPPTVSPGDILLAPGATGRLNLNTNQPATGHDPTAAPGFAAAPGHAASATPSTTTVMASSDRARHACSSCDKSFGRPADLRRHMRIHNPQAPRLSCPFEYCDRKGDKGFLRADKLKEHRRALGH